MALTPSDLVSQSLQNVQSREQLKQELANAAEILVVFSNRLEHPLADYAKTAQKGLRLLAFSNRDIREAIDGVEGEGVEWFVRLVANTLIKTLALADAKYLAMAATSLAEISNALGRVVADEMDNQTER